MKSGNWTYCLKCENCNNKRLVDTLTFHYDWQQFFSSIRPLVEQGFTYTDCETCKTKYTKQTLIWFDAQNKIYND